MASGCASTIGPELGLSAAGKLSPCPASPNCVSSDAGGDRAIPPLAIASEADAAWQALLAYIEAEPRWTIAVREPLYLRAESRTLILRFVDDVEFNLRPAEGQIAMRSASRLGYSDLGKNRRRLEAVREALAADGFVKSGT